MILYYYFKEEEDLHLTIHRNDIKDFVLDSKVTGDHINPFYDDVFV